MPGKPQISSHGIPSSDGSARGEIIQRRSTAHFMCARQRRQMWLNEAQRSRGLGKKAVLFA